MNGLKQMLNEQNNLEGEYMTLKKVDVKLHHPIIRITHKDGTVEEHRAKGVYVFKDPEELAKYLKHKKEGKK